MLCFIAASLC